MLSTPIRRSDTARVRLGAIKTTFKIERDNESLVGGCHRHPYTLCENFSHFRIIYCAALPVVRMALPANEVSTRWFSEKLFPTDCWPIDDTTFTGYAKLDV